MGELIVCQIGQVVKVKVREDIDVLVDETAAPMQRFTASQVHNDVLHEHERRQLDREPYSERLRSLEACWRIVKPADRHQRACHVSHCQTLAVC
jgi:hypothetical protein